MRFQLAEISMYSAVAEYVETHAEQGFIITPAT
jgi:hypothetical protein